MLVHTVYFYLKPDLTAEQRESFRQEVARLGEIPLMQAFYLGTPAGVPARPVIDLTFSYAITCVFRSVAEHDLYQSHPVHLEFIARCKEWWDRVQVYDAEG
jgi:hypothetical protein